MSQYLANKKRRTLHIEVRLLTLATLYTCFSGIAIRYGGSFIDGIVIPSSIGEVNDDDNDVLLSSSHLSEQLHIPQQPTDITLQVLTPHRRLHQRPYSRVQ